MSAGQRRDPISVIVVAFESGQVLDACLASLPASVSTRALDPWVIDNASTDDSAGVARRHLPADRVVQLDRNRGFSAGVNAGLQHAAGRWIAVINPDVVVSPGALERLADTLEARPDAGLAAPLVVRQDGRAEASVGRFPTARRERNHAMKLDRWPGTEGRTRRFPHATADVDWASGCAWLLRAEAVRRVGPLDETFFMYFDDVDYCRRLWNAGWSVVATPEAEVRHHTGHGSTATASMPAEGGDSALRYFAKHLTDIERAAATRWLLRGWQLRAVLHRIGHVLGHRASGQLEARYRRALALVGDR